MDWIDIGAWTLAGLMIAGAAFHFYRDARLLGANLFPLLKLTVRLAVRSGARFKLFLSLFGMVIAPVLPIPPPGRILCLAIVLSLIVMICRAPAIVMLASSRSIQAAALGDLVSSYSFGYHLTYMIRPLSEQRDNVRDFAASSPHGLGAAENDAMFNRYVAGDKWEEIVFPLLRLVPVIVIDVTHLSESLSHELSIVTSDEAHMRKCLVFYGNLIEVRPRAVSPLQMNRRKELLDKAGFRNAQQFEDPETFGFMVAAKLRAAKAGRRR